MLLPPFKPWESSTVMKKRIPPRPYLENEWVCFLFLCRLSLLLSYFPPSFTRVKKRWNLEGKKLECEHAVPNRRLEIFRARPANFMCVGNELGLILFMDLKQNTSKNTQTDYEDSHWPGIHRFINVADAVPVHVNNVNLSLPDFMLFAFRLEKTLTRGDDDVAIFTILH